MSAVVLAAVASLVAVVPAAAFSSSDFVGVSARRTHSKVAALSQYATQAAGLVDVYDVYAPRDVYAMEAWAAQYGMQKVSSEL